jgi:hypothetical protein
MILVHAKQLQLLGCGIQIGFGILFGVFGLFQSALGDGALVVKSLGAFQLDARQPFIVLGLQIYLVSPETSLLRTRSSNCPFFTVSPSRA